jgi:TonB family protein
MRSWRDRLVAGLFAVCLAALPVSADEQENTQNIQKVNTQVDLSGYVASLQKKIQKSWVPPEVIEQGHAVVIFKLDRDGNVIHSYIKESSGNNLYDISAMESIQKSSPFASFPEGYNKETLTMQYVFNSSVVSKDCIRELIEKADRYVNSNNQLALKYIDEAINTIQGDPSAYFLYARRHKINKLLGNNEESANDLAESKRLKALYDTQRINKCKEALLAEETPFAYFTLANAYELAGDIDNALYNIDKAISMTDLNHSYKRYRAEIIMRSGK